MSKLLIVLVFCLFSLRSTVAVEKQQKQDASVRGNGILRALLEDIGEPKPGNTPPTAVPESGHDIAPAPAGTPDNSLGDNLAREEIKQELSDDGEGVEDSTDKETLPNLPVDSLANNLARDNISGILAGTPGGFAGRQVDKPVPKDIGFDPQKMIRPVPNTSEYKTNLGMPQRLLENPQWVQLDRAIREKNWRCEELQRIRVETEARRDLSAEERAAMLRKIDRLRAKEQAEQYRAVDEANKINDEQRRKLPPDSEPEPDSVRSDLPAQSKDDITETSQDQNLRETMMSEQGQIGRESAGREAIGAASESPRPSSERPRNED